jgi:NADH dehydrogenase
MKRLLILGGSGFVGRALIARLVARGHGAQPLVVPTRRWAHATAIRSLPGVELIECDVHAPGVLAGLVAGCDAVVNLVAILQGDEARFRQVHVELPRHLVEACIAAGPRRIVHVSALGAAPAAPSMYLRSKAAGEAVLATSGLDVTVLRPSVIFGAEDRFLNLFAAMQAIVPVVPLAGAGARFQPVWVGDVAEAIARCLDGAVTAGQTIECAGPRTYTLAELVTLAGRWSGRARPVWPLPAPLARLQALAMEMLPGEPLMSRDNLASMQVDNVASGTLPGLAGLGIDAAPLEAVAPAYLGADGPQPLLDHWRGRVWGPRRR